MERKFFKVVLPVLFMSDESMALKIKSDKRNEAMGVEHEEDEDILQRFLLSDVRNAHYYSIDAVMPYSSNPIFEEYCSVYSGSNWESIPLPVDEVIKIIDAERERLANL